MAKPNQVELSPLLAATVGIPGPDPKRVITRKQLSDDLERLRTMKFPDPPDSVDADSESGDDE